MVVRVDKCSTFGIKKVLSKSAQYLPKLLINKDLIPTIKTGESFEYLGRQFDFNMTNEKHKSKLISLIDELMSEIDLKPLQKTKDKMTTTRSKTGSVSNRSSKDTDMDMISLSVVKELLKVQESSIKSFFVSLHG
jgi:hypothetical protein